MTSMAHPASPSRFAPVWTGCALLLVVTALSASLAHGGTRDANLAGALVIAAGTLAMAWHALRYVAYPRWAWFTTAVLMASAVPLSALLAPEPSAWRDVSSTSWMVPWFFLVAATTPQTCRGWCSPAFRWSGWVLVGVGTFFAAALLGAPFIAAALGR
jgi:hypothetical protein